MKEEDAHGPKAVECYIFGGWKSRGEGRREKVNSFSLALLDGTRDYSYRLYRFHADRRERLKSQWVARIYREPQRTMIRALGKTPLFSKTRSSGGTHRIYFM